MGLKLPKKAKIQLKLANLQSYSPAQLIQYGEIRV